jgi:hypothetical protein
MFEIRIPVSSRPEFLEPEPPRPPPPTERVQGVWKTIPTTVKSVDAFAGITARIELASGRSIPLKGPGLLERESLEGLDGAPVEAVVAPQEELPGRWVYHPAGTTIHPVPSPLGHGDVREVEVDGEVVARAEWHPGLPAGHRLLWVRRLP